MPEPTVPVQIDSIKRLKGFQRARCVFFRIEVTDMSLVSPYPVLPGDDALLAAWGNWAVLAGPGPSSETSGLFLTPESIHRTLKSIEENEGLFLDLGHIWLPNDLLVPKDNGKRSNGGKNKGKGIKGMQIKGDKIRVGDIYRLSLRLFSQCYLHIAEMITEDEWLASCRSFSDAVWPSPQETAAFRQWRRNRIKQSSDRYHREDYAGRRLPKKGMAK